jgi:ribonuclease J
MPFHGEYRMLKTHADLGIACGIPKENTFVLENGDVLEMLNGEIKKGGKIQAGDIYIDGNRIGNVGNAVMKDRKTMASDGIVVVIANIDRQKNILLGSPNITTRGFVLVNDNIELLKQLEEIVKNIINKKIKTCNSYNELKSEIINELLEYIVNKTGRKPIILPVIMDIKKND